MTKTISSQDYIDDEIVSAKRAARDYTVSVSPVFEIDGAAYRVLLDGHHSYEAAKMDGVEPELVELTASDHDAVALLAAGEIEDFLAAVHMGADYYDVETGQPAW